MAMNGKSDLLKLKLTLSYVGSYQNFVPGLLDYVTYHQIIKALTAPGQMNMLYDKLIKLPYNFVDVTLLGRFIENHDVFPRFANLTTDVGLRQTAFVFNILSDGIQDRKSTRLNSSH